MYPKLSNINETIFKKITQTPISDYSKLNCFVRIISGVGVKQPKFSKETKEQIAPGKGGLIMVSNSDFPLFQAAGVGPSIYGSAERSGTIGVDWFGNAVNTSEASEIDVPFKPSPIVTAINSKEGKDQISRHCDLKITAFTLAQVELIQKYFMEPGYSLSIEWGWNTPDGVSGLIPLQPSYQIVKTIGERNLDSIQTQNISIATEGDYCSFFGFIVGGNIDTNGDTFDIGIKLRGAPGLPTYLQSQANIGQFKDNKISNSDAHPPFGVTSLNLKEETEKAERRFKQMFNLLPKTRQTTQVVNLISVPGDGFSELDFVNFDPVIDAEISIFRDGREEKAGETTVVVEEEPKKVDDTTSGQRKKAADRKDAAFIQYSRLNNIAYKINSLIDPRYKEINQFSLFQDEEFIQYRNLYTITDDEVAEVLKTRFQITFTGTGSGDYGIPKGLVWHKYAGIEESKWPQVPPEPEPVVTAATTTSTVVEGTTGFTVGALEIGETEIRFSEGNVVPKEKFFSKNRYIRFGKAIQILNANSELNQYYLAKKPINVIINIKDAYIGAFEGIYSTKPESLLIPGRMPDFSKFFMQQNLVELNENSPLINNAIEIGTTKVEFAQSTALDSNGLKEDAYKWGKLEYLYINFELFKKELEKPNRTMREVLESLLNEMSLAANSFWNFQIVEKSATVKIKGEEVNTTAYTIIDENWIGKQVSTPVQFVHSGEKSRFLTAELTMDLSGPISQQVISKRLSLATNPDQPQVALGGIFTSEKDIFMPQYIGPAYSNTTTTTTTAPSTTQTGRFDDRFVGIEGATLTAEQKQQQKDLNQRASTNDADRAAAKDEYEKAVASYQKVIENANVEIERLDSIEIFNSDETEKDIKKEEAIRDAAKNKIIELEKTLKGKIDLIDKSDKELGIEVDEYLKGANAQVATNISNNLDLIDIVPNPAANTITQDDLVNYLNDINLFAQKFRIFCCRDQKFLNVLKMNKLGVTVSGGDRLSHPLPIKYSFSILGKTGIRKGDTFTIKGIPEKYSKHGFFQVTEVEHTVTDMKWLTKIQGDFRQIQ